MRNMLPPEPKKTKRLLLYIINEYVNHTPWRRVVDVISYLYSWRKKDVVKISLKTVCDDMISKVPSGSLVMIHCVLSEMKVNSD